MTQGRRIQIRVATMLALALIVAVIIVLNEIPRSVAQNNTSITQQEKPFDQGQKLADLMKQIAGKENQPAEQVFKNIQMFKGVPAARLLRIMELGYSRSLGVNCTHCHVVDQWDNDDKPTKPITREMAKMVLTINNDLLKNIKNLKGPNPIVNCTTCHRGQTKPALNLPEAQPKQ
jgi:Photosynthetic reaction centre cytochrome C subunit